MRTLWLDTSYACGTVSFDGSGVIRKTAPIWHRWRGQKARALIDYLTAQRQLKRWAEIPKEGPILYIVTVRQPVPHA